MDPLEEMMSCRDMMNKCNYPLEMLQGITSEIDKIITEGITKRTHKLHCPCKYENRFCNTCE